MRQPLHVLLVEDSWPDAKQVLQELREAGFEPVWQRVETETDYLTCLREDIEVVLANYQMPQFNGIRALELLKKHGFDIPFILVSGTIGEDTAVEAMRRGATDYLLKDRMARLGPAIRHALEESRLRAERKAAREVLRLRERALGEISQGVVICDENRLVLYANASFTQMTGYEQAEILGRSCSMLQGPQTDEETLRDIRAALEEERPFEGAILNYRKNGTTFWNELSIALIRGVGGGPARFIGILRDLTERRRVEAALRSETAFLEAQVDCALDGILVVDSQGKTILQNRRMNELWKIPRHIVECGDGARLLAFVAGRAKNPRQFIDKVLHLHAHPDEVSRDEIHLVDGTVLARYSAPVPEKGGTGKQFGRIWTFHDITGERLLAGEFHHALRREKNLRVRLRRGNPPRR